jgi:hypothetical protein
MLGFILMPIIVYIEKIVFLEKNASKKREITQIKFWIELSSLALNTITLNHIFVDLWLFLIVGNFSM